MPEAEAVPMDPHVILAEILSKLDRMAEAMESIDESVATITDYVEAADAALGELYAGKGRDTGRLSPASFLRAYGLARDDQDSEEGADDEEPGSLPGPGAPQ